MEKVACELAKALIAKSFSKDDANPLLKRLVMNSRFFSKVIMVFSASSDWSEFSITSNHNLATFPAIESRALHSPTWRVQICFPQILFFSSIFPKGSISQLKFNPALKLSLVNEVSPFGRLNPIRISFT